MPVHLSPCLYRSLVARTLLIAALYAAPGSASVLVTYPAPTTLENIAINSSGNIFTSALNTGTVYQVTPSGSSQVFGQAGTAAFGLAFSSGSLFAVGGSTVYQFGSQGGAAAVVTNIAGARQLNGLALLSPGMLLAADSKAGLIWQVDVNNGTSRVWSSDPSLAAASQISAGANGLKVFNGSVYVSNTSTATVLRIPILPGGAAGTPQTYAAHLSLDDFAFSSNGTLFGATQMGNSVVRLAPAGNLTTIATGADGLLGDASIAFGRTAADAQDIYVVNNGGAFENLPGGQQPGSIVQLDVGVNGAVPELEAVPEPASWAILAAGSISLTLLITGRRRIIWSNGNGSS